MVGVLASALLLGNVLPIILKTVQGFITFGAAWTTALFTMGTALVPPLVLFYGFLLFYKLAPRRRAGVTFAMVWVPALLVTALLVLCQQIFVIYTTHITNFNVIYGAFGGVIAVMLWIYLSGLIVVFGGCLCATWKRHDLLPPGLSLIPKTRTISFLPLSVFLAQIGEQRAFRRVEALDHLLADQQLLVEFLHDRLQPERRVDRVADDRRVPLRHQADVSEGHPAVVDRDPDRELLAGLGPLYFRREVQQTCCAAL